jgi:hypothetical protein
MRAVAGAVVDRGRFLVDLHPLGATEYLERYIFKRRFWFRMLRKAGRGAANHEACHEPMGDLVLALDSGVGPDPARARDRPRVDGGKRRRRGVAASERAGLCRAESCDGRARRGAGGDFSVARSKQGSLSSLRLSPCTTRESPICRRVTA